MDAGNLYKATNSLRATSKSSSSFRVNSSNIWRNTGIEVFSRSSREEDDEEALKWAALEKLPTFDRLRKGLLLGSKGANEVDVQNLEFLDKRNLVERLVNTVEEDNEKFLLKLRKRIDRYEHLNIDAEAYGASRALPTFVNFNINIIEGILNSLHILPSRKKPFTILKDVSGIIKPCRMTLLLGPPSSGKTTLLLALAGKLDPTLKVSGKVTYNGHGMEEFVPQRTAAYISQHDLHIGEMTVRETLAFSARCQEMLAELSRREKAANIKPDPDIDIYMKAAATEGDEASVVTDYILKVLGLDVCADTMVGDEMVRGISGGQKKRVTTGTAFISLLQPAPETYDLFDDIVLLADGQVVYHGPREHVLEFFESMGFKCPQRKGAADFLQEVTSKKDQQQYWARHDKPYQFISVKEFERRLKLAMTIYKLPVFYKQRDMFFFPAWAYGLPSWLLKIPITFIEVAIWTCLTYYVMGFDPNVGRQYLLLLFVHQCALALFRFIGAADDVQSWWIWGYWSSPLMYAQNAILVNEFTGHSWSRLVNGTELGVHVMRSRGFFPQSNWYWIGLGAVIGFIFLFNILFLIALAVLGPYEKPQAVLPEETEDGAMQKSISSESSSAETDENKKKGMILPFEPHSITFDDVRYSVDMPPEMKAQGASDDKLELLKGVSGAFRPGVLTALMGVSGAGKTTLMDNDIHSPNVTVYESLVYSAWLRLPREVDAEARKRIASWVARVNGLSTEQRKRLTIAVELVANPSIIFMDEPTSGLDARAAAIVMRTVRNTVNTGRTVVCTIHQPSIDIFEAFDELFLMKRGGQEIYVGPLGRQSTHLIKYFEEIEGVSKIKDGYNPATWMLEVTSSAQELLLGVDFTDHYKKSDLYMRNKALIKELSVPVLAQRIYFSPLNIHNLFSPSALLAFGNNTGHTGVILLIRLDTQQDLMNAMGSMYSAINFLGFQYCSTVQPVVAIERTVFYRERAAGMYSALPYAFSQFLIEIPYVFVQTIVYSLIVYSMMGFDWTGEKFLWFIYFMFFSLLYFVLYGMMTVAVTLITMLLLLYLHSSMPSGICSQDLSFHDQMPVWWRWYYWATPMAYSLYGLIVTQYGEIQDVMETGETVEDYLRNYFGFRHDMLPLIASVLLGFVVLFTVIFAYSIKTFNFQRR
ncbi:hypothetical protein DH2020_029128 [Rehmannia glutinosa]|uniref:ABC transporter domain-containing protein n=1 Tax=Rehmannia glutinosa TaxID=99300 RepID=A0ABR0VPI5_REHGL